jgi:hypothetical protein
VVVFGLCTLTSDFLFQEAGIDVRLGELGAAIQETMESYEVEVNGKLIPGEFLPGRSARRLGLSM